MTTEEQVQDIILNIAAERGGHLIGVDNAIQELLLIISTKEKEKEHTLLQFAEWINDNSQTPQELLEDFNNRNNH